MLWALFLSTAGLQKKNGLEPPPTPHPQTIVYLTGEWNLEKSFVLEQEQEPRSTVVSHAVRVVRIIHPIN